MPAYGTLDFLPDIDPGSVAGIALHLTLDAAPALPHSPWDFEASYASSSPPPGFSALPFFSFEGTQGARYDFLSKSRIEPALIQVYDQYGHVVATGGAVDDFVSIDPPALHAHDLVGFYAPYTGTFYVSPGWRQGTDATEKSVEFHIAEDVDTRVVAGTPSGDLIAGSSTLSDCIDGGAGTDVVAYALSSKEVSRYRPWQEAPIQITRFVHDPDTNGMYTSQSSFLSNVERIQFTDKAYAFEVDGTAGQVVGLYRAALNRDPDPAGQGYWMKMLDDQVATLTSLAEQFLDSPEYLRTHQGQDAQDFVAELYRNALHREPDAGGLAYYLGELATGACTRAQVLVQIVGSPEFDAGHGLSGIEYLPFGP